MSKDVVIRLTRMEASQLEMAAELEIARQYQILESNKAPKELKALFSAKKKLWRSFE